MKTLISTILIAGLLFAGNALAQEDALGLYFSNTEFTSETASATVVPGFVMLAYVVLTNPTGSAVDGYEVGITCTAADFGIPLINLFFDSNAGTNTNQIISFTTPKPVIAGGTVLMTIFLNTESTDLETIAFGASWPSSLPGDRPVVDYGSEGLVACGQPFGSATVAWLNGLAVGTEASSWGELKALFR